MSTPKLIAAISNVSMNMGHDGLTGVAKRFSIDFRKLEDHQLVLFINKQRDKLKLLGAKGTVLGYVKMPNKRTLPAGAVQFIPQTFSGTGQINVDAALTAYVESRMKEKASKESGTEISRSKR